MAKTILVVEDNELNLQLMVAILGHYGYEVLEARNGAQAMLIVRRQPIDLMLMENTARFMSCYEAGKRTRAEKRIAGIKIITVTSFALSEEKTRIMATGVDGFIAKPIDTREFPQIIQQMLESDSSEQGE